jgi:hypothetical protein
MTADNELASKRLPLKPAAHDRIREFRNGVNGDYSEAVLLLLDLVLEPGEDDYAAGKRLRAQLEQSRRGK